MNNTFNHNNQEEGDSTTIRNMVMNARSDWREKKADLIISLEFYLDGFVINRDGILRKRENPHQRRVLNELEKGRVPDELNRMGAKEIDCHVFRYDYNHNERPNKENELIRIDMF